MAASVVEIANVALIGLRATPISSLDDETPEALAVNVLWDMVRRSEIAKHPYNFAMKRAKLAKLTTTPLFGYLYQYQVPSDCLRVWSLIGNVDYKFEQGMLLTDDSSIELRYIFDNKDVVTWAPNFADLVAARLRVELSYALAGNKELTQQSYELYVRKSKETKWIDSSQDIPDRFGQGETRILAARG